MNRSYFYEKKIRYRLFWNPWADISYHYLSSFHNGGLNSAVFRHSAIFKTRWVNFWISGRVYVIIVLLFLFYIETRVMCMKLNSLYRYSDHSEVVLFKYFVRNGRIRPVTLIDTVPTMKLITYSNLLPIHITRNIILQLYF